MSAAQFEVVNQAKDPDAATGQIALYDADGNPISLGAGGSTTPTLPADGSITNAMLAGGITADKLAKGVIPTIPAAPTADTLSGATTTGKAVLKATDAAAARTAIGAGTSTFSGSYNDLTNKPTIPAAVTWANLSGKPATFTPPAATAAAVGGVKQAASVADLAADATTAQIVTAVNQLFANLRTAGTLAPKA